MAASSPHGGCWHGHPVLGFENDPIARLDAAKRIPVRMYASALTSSPRPFFALGGFASPGLIMRAIAPSALVLTKKYPSFGSTEPLPQLPPPSAPGNTMVGFIPTGVNGPSLCAPPSASNS